MFIVSHLILLLSLLNPLKPGVKSRIKMYLEHLAVILKRRDCICGKYKLLNQLKNYLRGENMNNRNIYI